MVALIYNTFMVYIPTANEKEEGLLPDPVMCTTTRYRSVYLVRSAHVYCISCNEIQQAARDQVIYFNNIFLNCCCCIFAERPARSRFFKMMFEYRAAKESYCTAPNSERETDILKSLHLLFAYSYKDYEIS